MKFLGLLGKLEESGVAERQTLYAALGAAAIVFVLGWIGLRLIDPGFAAVLVNWAYTVLTGLLVFVVFTQVGQARRSAKESLDHSDEQRRKWATLQACDRYDTDPELTAAVRCLRKYHPYSGPNRLLPPGVQAAAPANAAATVNRAESAPTHEADLTPDQSYTLAAGLLLNYFDSIAIGIRQNFYIKEICKEHIGPIFVSWMKRLRAVDSDVFDRQMAESFERLPSLLQEWDC